MASSSRTSMIAAAASEPKGFSFPVLKPRQILECLQDLQIPITEECLSAPEQHRDAVVRVFEKLVDATTGITREEMAQPVFAGLSVLNYAELHDDSIPDLAFYRACSKMMMVSCVSDFSLQDLLKPDKNRLRRLLSAVINFCKFREERLDLYNELATRKEKLLLTMNQLQEENAKNDKVLSALKEQTAEDALIIEEVEHDCRQIEARIQEKNRQQAEIRQESSELKKLSNELKDRNASLSLAIERSQMEKEKLQAQVVNSPVRIRREMADRQGALEQERTEGLNAEKDAMRVEMSVMNVANAEAETLKVVKALEEVEAEISKQKVAVKEVKVTQATVTNNRAKSSEETAHVQNVQHQVTRFEEKTVHLRKQWKQKSELASEDLQMKQSELRVMESERRQALTQLQAAEAEVARMDQLLQQEAQERRDEMDEMIVAYKRMESVVLQHQGALMAAIRGGSVAAGGSGGGGGGVSTSAGLAGIGRSSQEKIYVDADSKIYAE